MMKRHQSVLLAISALLMTGVAARGQWADLDEKIDSPGFKALVKAREEFKKSGALKLTLPKGKRFKNAEEVKAFFKQAMEKRQEAIGIYRKNLDKLRKQFMTDKAINKIRLDLIFALFQMDDTKAGKNELSLLDPLGLTLNERMLAIRVMTNFNMKKKASTMLIGMDPNKIRNDYQRLLVITLLAATGDKARALKALEEDLADMEDDEEMWEEVDDMSKRILSFSPSLARPLLAALYEETLRRYPGSAQKAKRSTALKGLQMSIGEPAVPLYGTDLEGKSVSLTAMKGKVVFLHFWASWNHETLEETKELLKLHEKYKDKGFAVLGVALDKPASDAKAKAKSLKLPWSSLCDGLIWRSKYVSTYAIKRLPFSMVIGRDGTIQAMCLTGKELEAKLKDLF